MDFKFKCHWRLNEYISIQKWTIYKYIRKELNFYSKKNILFLRLAPALLCVLPVNIHANHFFCLKVPFQSLRNIWIEDCAGRTEKVLTVADPFVLIKMTAGIFSNDSLTLFTSCFIFEKYCKYLPEIKQYENFLSWKPGFSRNICNFGLSSHFIR